MKTESIVGRFNLKTWERLREKLPKFEGESLASYMERVEKEVSKENDN